MRGQKPLVAEYSEVDTIVKAVNHRLKKSDLLWELIWSILVNKQITAVKITFILKKLLYTFSLEVQIDDKIVL